MKHILTAIVCLGSLLMGLAATVFAATPVEKTAQSTPRILVVWSCNIYDANNKLLKEGIPGIATGTGVLIHKDHQFGTVITNSHVLPQMERVEEDDDGNPVIVRTAAYQVFVIFPRKGEGPRIYRVVENVLRSKEGGMDVADLAAMRISCKGLPDIVPFKKTPLSVGTHVYALGYPGILDSSRNEMVNLGVSILDAWVEKGKPDENYFTIKNLSNVQNFLTMTTTQGSVQRVDDHAGALNKIYHGAQIDHGNSGGPLVTEDGLIVGINTWGKTQSANWYISMAGPTVVGMLMTNSVQCSLVDARDDTSTQKPDTAVSVGGAGNATAGAAPGEPAAAPDGAADNKVLYISIGAVVFVVVVLSVALLTAGNGKPVLTIQVDSNQNCRDAGRAFVVTEKMLSKGEILLGRGDMCGLKMRDEHVSRAHCGIFRSGNCICIVDKGSKAGTKLNDSPLPPGKPASLNKGATLELGKIKAHIC